ncbi:MAG TPA: SURF1 family cytochrome oxidase biogenesis protein [Caulobacter sp.]|nr:SURF1 family cytochrome oxidase biogenesis protein [Caulobacter sp.]
MTARRFPIGLTLATAVALAILCGLGVWQLKRLAWKTELLASIAAAQAAPPRPIGQTPLTPAYRFRRVTLDCPGLAGAPFVELYAINSDGVAGRRLVSLCRPVGARTQILVDRGFVADTVSARPPVQPSTAVVHLTGVLREGETPGAFTPPTRDGLFYVRDIGQMARALGATRHPRVMILAETSSNPAWKALVPTPLPPDIPNRHLEYALTWFGLAGALVAVYAALLRRGLKAA